MWSNYRTLTKDYFPNAVCAVDKFHVFQDLSRKITRVRINEMNKFKPVNDKPYNELTQSEKSLRHERYINYYLLKKFNWLLFKTEGIYNDPNWERKQNKVLRGCYNYYELRNIILNSSPKLLECYNLQFHLKQFYNLKYDEAKNEINVLIERFKNSNISEMNDFANTLINWKNEVVNSFIVVNDDGRTITNAIIENRNRSIKTIKRNAKGYTNWERFKNRVMYSINKSATHRLYRKKRDQK